MKKNYSQKFSGVKDDQKYLQGINLITGDKYDYSKHILTETQINALCVPQKLSKIQKIINILTQGQKIQKWSVFQNLPYYIDNSQNAQKIFSLLQKNFNDYDPFIIILGQGINSYLKACQKNTKIINKKIYDIAFRLILRTLTSVKYQGSQLLLDWISALKTFLQIPNNNDVTNSKQHKINDIKQYINGSFSMNTLPQRRKTAFQIINATLQLSQDIYSQAHTKILFFNNDLNPSTRLIICSIIEKMLMRDPNNSEIWKCVLEYFSIDKNYSIKQKAFSILTNIYYAQNSDVIFHAFQSQQKDMMPILLSNIIKIIKNFQKQIKKDTYYQTKLISFINRLLKNRPQDNISIIIDSFHSLSSHISQIILLKQIQLKSLDIQKVIILSQLIKLYHYISQIESKQFFKRIILKGIRYHQFHLNLTPILFNSLLQMLQTYNEEDISIFILLFNNQLQQSKWKNLQLCLKYTKNIKFHQGPYQKITQIVLKLYSNSPYYMIQLVNQVILQMMLADKKNMQIYQKIKERYISSRCWTHRRNYIKLYAYIKKNASFQFNKYIATYVYKNILSQKNILLKQQFIKQITKAYSFIDPTQQQERSSIKQVIFKLTQDKDYQLSTLAIKSLQDIKEIDKDIDLVHYRMDNNKQLLKKELNIEAVQPEIKRHIKTQKIIGKDKDFKDGRESRDHITLRQSKSKKVSIGQTKTTLNLIKIAGLQKNKLGFTQQKMHMIRSNSNNHKKDNKLILPSLSVKKSKF